MPSFEEMPRGWTIAVSVTNATPQVVLPATPGIVHVLTDAELIILNGNAGVPVTSVLTVNTGDGVYNGFPLGGTVTGTGASTSPWSTGVVDRTVSISSGPGQTLTVQAPAIGGPVSQYLIATGYDT